MMGMAIRLSPLPDGEAFAGIKDGTTIAVIASAAKQSGKSHRLDTPSQANEEKGGSWMASSPTPLAMTQSISPGFARERSKELSWIR